MTQQQLLPAVLNVVGIEKRLEKCASEAAQCSPTFCKVTTLPAFRYHLNDQSFDSFAGCYFNTRYDFIGIFVNRVSAQESCSKFLGEGMRKKNSLEVLYESFDEHHTEIIHLRLDLVIGELIKCGGRYLIITLYRSGRRGGLSCFPNC